MSTLKPTKAACPQCKKLIEYSLSNKFRPFCSERCQLIDLGEWANENFKIAENRPINPNEVEH